MPTTFVVYVALGERRITAAIRQTASAAGRGSTVLLVVPGSAGWRAAEIDSRVTVRHVTGTGRRAGSAARRFLLGPDAPPADASVLLVAGDPGALPVAWAAARRRPAWRVVTDLDAGSGRRPAPAGLALVTPWYPAPNDDFAGAFVQATADAVTADFGSVSVLHTEGWFYARTEASRAAIDPVIERLAAVNGTVTVTDTHAGELTRVTAPSGRPGGYGDWITDHVRALRAALPTGRIEAPVVHAHTGMYAGVAAAALARTDARLVVTEHASFLPRVLRHAPARRMYATMLDRADVLLCVGAAMRDYLAAEFPAHAAKLRVVPNPIDFTDFGVRPDPPADLHRWLYVGRLIELKRVGLLLEAFALVAAADPGPTLTLVGSGPLAEPLRDRAAELGLADRVRLLPPVAPDRVPGLLRKHDLLVHLSERETFGMTVVEAIATGTPVLVSRTDGTAATMAGLHGRAGLLIDLDGDGDGDPAEVARAWAELRALLPRLDPHGSRAELAARYGRDAVAAQLRHYYTGDLARPAVETPAPVPDPAPDADRVVLVAVDAAAVDQARPLLHETVADGRWVDLVTCADVPDQPGVRVHRVRPAGPDRVRAIEELALRHVPGKGLDLLLAAARRRPGPALEVAIRRAQRLHGQGATVADRLLVRPWWNAWRERALPAAVRDQVLPRLDPDRIRAVLAATDADQALAGLIADRCHAPATMRV